ncbi:MFS transporter [Lacticaseibacillus mingshuiensis]|uniref:MFS transporter n=2 Tax=Lacticaseibacillus mingshuiensis TaxID=2799574 RepID=A0ABW4CLU7_9LACO|nr:MFS transporter [Lacticaseibacillus mingshuiensis]
MEEKQVTRQTGNGERISFWSYFTGQGMANSFLTGMLTTYLLMNGIALAQVAFAMVAVKLWDAMSDTFFGVLFDKIHFKSGRSLPWLRVAMVMVPVMTIIVFNIPGFLTPEAKLLWFALSYVLWDTVYTISDVPIYNLVTLMTSDTTERNSILSIARMAALVGTFVTSMVATFMVSEAGGFTFGTAAIVLAILMFLLMSPVSFVAKERVHTTTQSASYTLRQMWQYVRSNKYLQRYYLYYIIAGITWTNSAVDLFVSYYFFGSALVSTLTMVAMAIPMALLAPLMGMILKHVDKFRLFFWSAAALALTTFFVYLGGTHSLWVYLALVALRSIPQGVVLTLNLTFTPDVVEYGKFSSGIDARGIAFAIQSFSGKLISLAQPLGLFVLGLFAWQPIQASSFADLQKMAITQSTTALNGLWLVAELLPAIGAAVALIPLLFYHLNDHDVQLMASANAGTITADQARAQLSRKY